MISHNGHESKARLIYLMYYVNMDLANVILHRKKRTRTCQSRPGHCYCVY